MSGQTTKRKQAKKILSSVFYKQIKGEINYKSAKMHFRILSKEVGQKDFSEWMLVSPVKLT